MSVIAEIKLKLCSVAAFEMMCQRHKFTKPQLINGELVTDIKGGPIATSRYSSTRLAYNALTGVLNWDGDFNEVRGAANLFLHADLRSKSIAELRRSGSLEHSNEFNFCSMLAEIQKSENFKDYEVTTAENVEEDSYSISLRAPVTTEQISEVTYG